MQTIIIVKYVSSVLCIIKYAIVHSAKCLVNVCLVYVHNTTYRMAQVHVNL